MKRFLNLRTLAFPVAAALAVIFSVVLRPHAPADVPAIARIEPAPWEPSGDENAVPRLHDAMELYRNREWQQAISELNAAIPSLGTSDAGLEARLYLGICLIQSGQPAEAIDPLRIASTTINRPQSERACWYRAQAHLLLGQVEDARPLLNELSRTSAAYARSASEELLALRGK